MDHCDFRIHVAEPKARDNKARPSHIPEAVWKKREEKLRQKQQAEEEEEGKKRIFFTVDPVLYHDFGS